MGWAGLHFGRRRRSSVGERAEEGLNGIRPVQWWDGGQDEDYRRTRTTLQHEADANRLRGASQRALDMHGPGFILTLL